MTVMAKRRVIITSRVSAESARTLELEAEDRNLSRSELVFEIIRDHQRIRDSAKEPLTPAE